MWEAEVVGVALVLVLASGCGNSKPNATEGGATTGGAAAGAGGEADTFGGTNSGGIANSGGVANSGGTSAGGSSEGGAPSGSGGAGPFEIRRIRFEPGHFGFAVELCDAAACPGNKRCFPITREFGVCDALEVPEATELVAAATSSGERPADECGCGTLSCPSAEQAYRALSQECWCQGYHYNVCVERACGSEAECGDAVCIPSSWIVEQRCLTPRCRADAECDADPDGRCVAWVATPLQAGNVSLSAVRCLYPGPAGGASASCARPSNFDAQAMTHTCDAP